MNLFLCTRLEFQSLFVYSLICTQSPTLYFYNSASSESIQFPNKLSLEKPPDSNNADTYQQPGSFKKEKE